MFVDLGHTYIIFVFSIKNQVFSSVLEHQGFIGIDYLREVSLVFVNSVSIMQVEFAEMGRLPSFLPKNSFQVYEL